MLQFLLWLTCEAQQANKRHSNLRHNGLAPAEEGGQFSVWPLLGLVCQAVCGGDHAMAQGEQQVLTQVLVCPTWVSSQTRKVFSGYGGARRPQGHSATAATLSHSVTAAK